MTVAIVEDDHLVVVTACLWSTARGVESALWAANRGWWTGFRGLDGEVARAQAWATATTILGG